MKRDVLVVMTSGVDPVRYVQAEDADCIELHWHPRAPLRANAIRVRQEHRKFEAWHNVHNGARWQNYCLADDDVEPVHSWNDIFDAFLATGMDVGMPALTQDSYCAHPITMRDPSCRWRKTNYLDLMCVLFTAEGLHRHWDTFSAPREPWGIESIWAQREIARGKGIAILDETPIRHVRPINCDPERVQQAMADCKALLERFGVDPIREHKVLERYT